MHVHASGLNPLDIKISNGAPAHAKQPLPAVFGLDLAGTVVELGDAVIAVVVYPHGGDFWGCHSGDFRQSDLG